jgi:hypothetical protein
MCQSILCHHHAQSDDSAQIQILGKGVQAFEKCIRVSKTNTCRQEFEKQLCELTHFKTLLQQSIKFQFRNSEILAALSSQRKELRKNTLAVISSHCVPFPDAGAPEIMILSVCFPAKAFTSNCTIIIASFKNEKNQ